VLLVYARRFTLQLPDMKAHNDSTHTPAFDSSVRPQDDFFGYVNNPWLAAHPIPDTETRWGTFMILRDEAWANMRTLYEGLIDADVKQGTIEQQARDLYYTGMHFDDLEAAHLTRIAAYLQEIDDVTDLSSLSGLLGKLEAMGVPGLWRTIVDTDNEDASRHIMRLEQPSLSLPDRDYYLEDTKKMKAIRQAYEHHALKVCEYVPHLTDQAMAFWSTTWQVELDFATQSRSRILLRDVKKNYNRQPFSALARDYNAVDWDAYAAGLGWKTGADISVDQPEFFSYIDAQLKTRPLEDWKTYLKWRLVMTYCSRISNRFADLQFEFFGRVLTGAQEIMPLWKRVVLNIDNAIGEGVGRLYAEKHFPESSKQQVRSLVEIVRATYAQRITELDWMSEATKKLALEKLANIKVLIGYPDMWRDYTSLAIGRTSYLDNLIAAEQFDTAYYLAKLDQPTSRDDWFMYPQTVNAYNDPGRLVICFPAAILQKPFFDPAAHIAVNMGGIGTVIGHELTHGFDDQGCLFDAHGNVKTWQTAKERAAFAKRAQLIIDHADHFEVLPGLCMKGKLVIGESIADLGGVEIAYAALQQQLHGDLDGKTVDGLSLSQLFFVSYAATECSHSREERLREQTVSDPHPNERFRVNGILSHVDAFYQAFSVIADDALYRTSQDRAKIW
jgi:putative endopeptidase